MFEQGQEVFFVRGNVLHRGTYYRRFNCPGNPCHIVSCGDYSYCVQPENIAPVAPDCRVPTGSDTNCPAKCECEKLKAELAACGKERNKLEQAFGLYARRPSLESVLSALPPGGSVTFARGDG